MWLSFSCFRIRAANVTDAIPRAIYMAMIFVQSYVKMDEIHVPRGLYVYGSGSQVNPKRNAKPQGSPRFPFGI